MDKIGRSRPIETSVSMHNLNVTRLDGMSSQCSSMLIRSATLLVRGSSKIRQAATRKTPDNGQRRHFSAPPRRLSESSSSYLFLKRPFLPHSARVRRFSRYEASPHIPEYCRFRVQTKLNHIIFHTFIPFIPSLPPSTHTSQSPNHHISTGRHLIIPTLTFHMPKPPQSTLPHHLSHALYTQKTVQIHTALPILQGVLNLCYVSDPKKISIFVTYFWSQVFICLLQF